MAAKTKQHRHSLPSELVSERVRFASSGAAGVHADQKARKHRTGLTNRVGSRSARGRAAVRMEER